MPLSPHSITLLSHFPIISLTIPYPWTRPTMHISIRLSLHPTSTSTHGSAVLSLHLVPTSSQSHFIPRVPHSTPIFFSFPLHPSPPGPISALVLQPKLLHGSLFHGIFIPCPTNPPSTSHIIHNMLVLTFSCFAPHCTGNMGNPGTFPVLSWYPDVSVAQGVLRQPKVPNWVKMSHKGLRVHQVSSWSILITVVLLCF